MFFCSFSLACCYLLHSEVYIITGICWKHFYTLFHDVWEARQTIPSPSLLWSWLSILPVLKTFTLAHTVHACIYTYTKTIEQCVNTTPQAHTSQWELRHSKMQLYFKTWKDSYVPKRKLLSLWPTITVNSFIYSCTSPHGPIQRQIPCYNNN
jgi:hypothetical protein